MPTGDRQLAGNLLGEADSVLAAIAHAQHGNRRTQAEKTHAVAAFALNLISLLRQRQPVDFDNIVQHPGEHLDDLAERVPVETRLVGKRIDNESGQIYRTQQARTVWRQWLLSARVGRTNIFAEPVVVHFIDLVDQYEARLRKVVGRRHDQIPDAVRRHRLVNLARDEPSPLLT